jgi:hypothetical protein
MPRKNHAAVRARDGRAYRHRRQRFRRCGRDKSLRAFERAGKYTRRVCRRCRREAGRRYYRANRDIYRASNERRIRAAQALVAERLLLSPCADCGEADITCLEFHHLRDKQLTISQLIFSRRRSLDALVDEMNKCVVLCGNCHRRRTLGVTGSS